MKPTGDNYMKTFRGRRRRRGMRELKRTASRLPDVTGETLGERLAGDDEWVDHALIAKTRDAGRAVGGPGGAVRQPGAAAPS